MRNPLVATIVLVCVACASCGTESEVGQTATLSLRAAVPYLAGEICFEVGFGERPVRELCGPIVDGRFAAEVSLACDPSVATVRTTLRVGELTGTSFDDSRQLASPCAPDGCALDVGCGTGPTEVALVLADDDTHADWTSTQVATGSGWFGARFATCGNDEPLLLLTSGGDVRRATAVLGFGAFGPRASSEVRASTPVVACGADVRCPLPLPALAADPEPRSWRGGATCSDGSALRYAVYTGTEATEDPADWSSFYLNVAIDLQDLIDAGHVDCRITHAATLSDGSLMLGRADAHPVASTHAQLLDADGAIACASVSFDDYGDEDPELLGVDFVRGWNLAPLGGAWRFVPALCNRFDGAALTPACD